MSMIIIIQVRQSWSDRMQWFYMLVTPDHCTRKAPNCIIVKLPWVWFFNEERKFVIFMSHVHRKWFRSHFVCFLFVAMSFILYICLLVCTFDRLDPKPCPKRILRRRSAVRHKSASSFYSLVIIFITYSTYFAFDIRLLTYLV